MRIGSTLWHPEGDRNHIPKVILLMPLIRLISIRQVAQVVARDLAGRKALLTHDYFSLVVLFVVL